MKPIWTVLVVFGIVLVLSQYSTQEPINKSGNDRHPDLINIDEGSLHNSKPRPKPAVTIDRDDDDEDGDDSDVIDGSGSGASEVKLESTTLHPTQYPGPVVMETPSPMSTMDDRKIKEIIIQEKGSKPLKDASDNNTQVLVYGNNVITLVSDDDNEHKKSEDKKAASHILAEKIKETGKNPTLPEETKQEQSDRICEALACKYGAKCIEKEPLNFECICPVGTCADEEGAEVCGSDGKTYRGSCQLEMESCKQQKNISIVKQSSCEQESLEICPLFPVPKWSPWSMWIESGASEFRFRVCLSHETGSSGCDGKSIEERKCRSRRVGNCQSPLGKPISRKESKCEGSNVADYTKLDILLPSLKNEDYDCMFSLYDTAESKFVHTNWTLNQLLNKGDPVVWCAHRGMFVPFVSANQRCSHHLKDFCNKPKVCAQKKRKGLKDRGDFKKKCWKKFLLGESLPVALPLHDKYFICQRFADETEFAHIFGNKPLFTTVYDTKRKIPLISFGRFSSLGDKSWPAVPTMIEKGLKKIEPMDVGLKKKREPNGLQYVSTEDMTFEQRCQLGVYQAIESDYENQPYQLQYLLAPELAGSDVAKRIATLSMTNTVPIHASIYSAWKQALESVRKYAINVCGVINLDQNVENHHRRKKNNSADLHILAGGVPSENKTIGNDVNVPDVIWLAGCCVKGGETKSFAIYVRNVQNGQIISAPVEQVEVLLSDLHKSEPTVRLFPALNGMCADLQNDVSKYVIV
ncbi:uncharacterized protein LOC134244193 isoform X2 [Saccostrea cucullata]|uniref:uncharacterized protein LOC134244193 isoform X2 n=1 Tax=Saccostrea cuccullata TaxID=36930 RepID=UPI002ED5B118